VAVELVTGLNRITMQSVFSSLNIGSNIDEEVAEICSNSAAPTLSAVMKTRNCSMEDLISEAAQVIMDKLPEKLQR
jgi:hypothetical protein